MGEARQRAQAQRTLNEEELKRLHSQYRLELSERIENCLRPLPQYFPGFRYETLVGDRGWGAAVSRDDLQLEAGRRTNYFSRLEMTVRPFSSLHVLELVAKGTVRNKEIFNRNHFQPLAEAELAAFETLADHWVLEYAELYAARTKGRKRPVHRAPSDARAPAWPLEPLEAARFARASLFRPCGLASGRSAAHRRILM